MRIVAIEFMSLDGVVQAPGGPDEDTDGGFAHGGWSHPFFDPEVVGGAFDDAMTETDALLFGRRTWQTMTPVRRGANWRRQPVWSRDTHVAAGIGHAVEWVQPAPA